MPARKGPKKVNKYFLELKRTAVRLTEAPGARVKDVAESLDIHPFILSRWRKLAREGPLVTKPKAAKVKAAEKRPDDGRGVEVCEVEARARSAAQGARIPKKVRSLPCATEGERFAFIARERGRFEVTWMCARLEVSRSGFYAWLGRAPSRRTERDQVLELHILGHFEESQGVYGAIARRRPAPGLVFHSDRGSEYGGYLYRDGLAHRGIVQSMNRPKTMTDNAHVESFFHTLKAEAIHGRSFANAAELESVVRDYVRRYNRTRMHSPLGYLSPVDYERANA